ncbi:hypothetical protein EYS14_15140 [Alteromonadaceae bacterium M269]|nr:hypothetical protein EYS14_15140 [Alteromonadaceae bacterium M269]
MKQLLTWITALSLTFTAGFFTHKLSENKLISNTQPEGETSAFIQDETTYNSVGNSRNKQVVSIEYKKDSILDNRPRLSLVELTDELELLASNKAGRLTFSEISRLYLLVADLPEDKIQALIKQFSIESLEDNNPAFTVLFSK